MPEHFSHVVRGSGPGLLLAHGAGGGVAPNFGPILDDLAGTRTVVGPDYPGSGETPPTSGPLVLDEVADGLVATAVDAGVPRFAVLGYSLGTAVAVRVATRHPERVTGLALTAGFARPDHHLRLALEVWRALLDGDRDVLATFLTLVAVGQRPVNAMAPAELAASIDQLAADIPAGSAAQVDLALGVDTRSELPDIAVPALVVATAADALAGPDLSRELAAGLPNAELVEIVAGHGIMTEARDEWLAVLQRFLSGVD